MSYFRLLSVTVSLGLLCPLTPLLAQITSTANTTNTAVTQNGQNWDISGGSTSAGGNNLFHDFQDFNVGTNQSATFLSAPAIQNILSRISGANPSLIDGLLSISGSNADLYLINPSGIVFGENTQLNLPADFTATTATGLGFGSAIWSGQTNYNELIGSPNQFFFDGTGGIINGADLKLNVGNQLNLFASHIVNTGSLSAESGTINLTAVPGTNTLRLSQAGQLLNLEFNNGAPANVVDIPRLLTGHNLATGVTLNDGAVELSETQTPVTMNSGNLFMSGSIDVSGNLGGTSTLLGNEIILTSANLDASGLNGGGEIYLGGDFQGQGLFTNAKNVFVDPNSTFSTAAIATGDGGQAIIWSDQSTLFYGNIDATGGQFGGNGGFVEVSGKQYLDFQGTVDLRSPLGTNGTLLLDPTDIIISDNPTSPTLDFMDGVFDDITNTPSNLNVFDLQFQLELGDILITTNSGNADLGNIVVDSPFTWSSGNTLELEADNDIFIRANIVSTSQDATLVLVANNDIRVEGMIQVGAFDNTTMTIDFIPDADGDGVGIYQQDPNAIVEGSIPFEESDFDGDFGDDEFGGDFGDDEFGDDFGDDEFGDDEFGDDEFGDDEFEDEFGDDEFGDDEFEEGEDDEDFDEDDDDFFGSDFDYEYEDDGWSDYDEELDALEDDFFDDYGEHFGLAAKPDTNFDAVQSKLATIQSLLDIDPAIIYVAFRDKESRGTKQSTKQTIGKDKDILWQFDDNARQNYLDIDREALGNDELELVMLTASGKVVRRRIVGSSRQEILRAARSFNRSITSPHLGNTYLRSAKYFYDLLIKPLEAELNEAQIDNLTFVMDRGLRTLPIAALHDGQQFVIEKYSVGMMPSFALTQTDYLDLRESQVLAMGASEFQQQNDLPAVPVELSEIADRIWEGDVYSENQFTVDRLLAARDRQEYGILHLATHGEFLPGNLARSYIQFWDQRVSLAELPKLQLNNPPIELLVLSACRTAFGDPNAELGFAGLAIASGAKSAIGSLWYVSDEGTLALMTEFYRELQSLPIKAEALRQAQLALLNGEVQRQGGTLITPAGPIDLPETFSQLQSNDLSHPYFWSSFSLIGNPW
ncbi:filamentous hemagglutinin family outer membrane protein [[Leptolyngbya] sp. PCC 7376]|uniref:CHAT domain-containing protein n=1 Tax=[Leptolyngbya] sp. PCC 7376 TaxID=111781 RepID=UPI00029F1296|nr:CHAT domain-containing protein [[Leptolyngbya] sp. PCC 7376]AFY39154.1 filamentous hemagglutinin family outer membrane protein [[Leptolyngbya] sp. PCC 7376]